MPIQPNPNADTSILLLPVPNVLFLVFEGESFFSFVELLQLVAIAPRGAVVNNTTPAIAPVFKKSLRLLFFIALYFYFKCVFFFHYLKSHYKCDKIKWLSAYTHYCISYQNH